MFCCSKSVSFLLFGSIKLYDPLKHDAPRLVRDEQNKYDEYRTKKNNELVKYSDQAWTRLVNKTSVDEQADFVFVQNTEKTIRLIRTNFDIQHWKH